MLRNYILTAIKVLMRRKFFTFVNLFAICFTLVVLMVVAAIFDHVLAPRAPESLLSRSLYITQLRMSGDDWTTSGHPGYGFLDKHARDLPGVEQNTFYTSARPTATYLDGQKIDLSIKYTDGDYWRVLDFNFLEGEPFTDDDDSLGNRVAVISQRARTRLFDDQPALGKSFKTGQNTFRVVGVVANVSYLRDAPFSDIWAPLSSIRSSDFRTQFSGSFNAILVAESEQRVQSVQEEFASRLPDIQLPDPEHYDTLTVYPVTPLEALSMQVFDPPDMLPRAGRFKIVLALGALLFMLLPSLNLVNLNLSRTLERSSEIGVRRAFGARSGTLMVQFLIENLLLTLVGGLIGWVLAGGVLKILNNADLVPFLNLGLNPRVFLWGMGLSIVFGLLSGAYPAWKMSRLRPVEALHARSKL